MRTCFVLAFFLLLSAAAPVNGQTTPSGPIPAEFFGMHVARTDAQNTHGLYSSFPTLLHFGSYRSWDVGYPELVGSANSAVFGTAWPLIQSPCKDGAQPCWEDLDAELAALKTQGVDDVLFTLSRTPQPFGDPPPPPPQPAPPSYPCAYAKLGINSYGVNFAGECLPPDYDPVAKSSGHLNIYGSGDDALWTNWVVSLVLHVSSLPSSQYAHIKYWEVWNEFDRNPNPDGYCGPPAKPNHPCNAESWDGNDLQLVRMMEDARCIILKTGTIHNYPAAGQSTLCGSGMPYWSSLSNYTPDPGTRMVAPSVSTGGAGGQPLSRLYYVMGNPYARVLTRLNARHPT